MTLALLSVAILHTAACTFFTFLSFLILDIVRDHKCEKKNRNTWGDKQVLWLPEYNGSFRETFHYSKYSIAEIISTLYKFKIINNELTKISLQYVIYERDFIKYREFRSEKTIW